MRVYKLTDKDDCTHGKTQWAPGVTHETDGEGELCGPGWIHGYKDQLVGEFMNPIHGDYHDDGHMWEMEAEGKELEDHGLKWGWTKVTAIRRVERTIPSLTQRCAFGILCALEVYHEPTFVSWAAKWLSGEDRSEAAARVARDAWAPWTTGATWTTWTTGATWTTWATGATWATWAARDAWATTREEREKLFLPTLAAKAMTY